MHQGPVAHPDDVQDIQDQVQRHPADDPHAREQHVYNDYRQAKHLEAAAHHLKASDAALRRGDKGAVDRHRLHYDLHRRALGLHRETGVPAAIRARLAGAKIDEKAHGFVAHSADAWVLRK